MRVREHNLRCAATGVFLLLFAGCHRSRFRPASHDASSGAPRTLETQAEPPRIVSPLSGSTISSSHVVFRWSPESEGHIQLSRSASFASIVEARLGTGTAALTKIEDGHWFWRVIDDHSAKVSAVSRLRIVSRTTSSARQGILYGTDVNGDGLADLVFHQDVFLGRSHIEENDGRTVPLLPNAATPCNSAPVNPTNPMDRVRCANVGQLVPIGDVDADGFDDLLAPAEPHCVFFFRGASQISSPWRAAGRVCRASAGVENEIVRFGDINGDGFADVGLSVGNGLGVYLSGPNGIATSPSTVLQRSRAWASGGDFDGDGYDDAASLLDDGRLVFYRGGPGGFSMTPASQVPGAYPFGQNDNPRGIDPQLRVADLDADGLADIVGIRPGATSMAQPEFFFVPGATAFEVPALRAIAVWPFQGWATPQFAWDVFVAPGRSKDSVVFVADRGMLGGEVNPVPFKVAAGFVMPARLMRLDDPGAEGRSPFAVGDVNGDGFEDMFAIMSEDMDGSRNGELYLGNLEGISTADGRYTWPYEYSSSTGNTVAFEKPQTIRH